MIQILTKMNLNVPIQWISMRAANLGFRMRSNKHWDSCRMIWRPSGFQRRRVNGEIDDDGREGIRRGPSQVAAKGDLHPARAPLCDHFLFFFFCREEELLLELPTSAEWNEIPIYVGRFVQRAGFLREGNSVASCPSNQTRPEQWGWWQSATEQQQQQNSNTKRLKNILSRMRRRPCYRVLFLSMRGNIFSLDPRMQTFILTQGHARCHF